LGDRCDEAVHLVALDMLAQLVQAACIAPCGRTSGEKFYRGIAVRFRACLIRIGRPGAQFRRDSVPQLKEGATAYDNALGVGSGVAQLAQKPRRGWVRCRRACGLSGARWVSRMRQSDAGGSGTGMERGVVSIPAPGATSLSSTLSTMISNASIV
jgi:hypothetical protein